MPKLDLKQTHKNIYRASAKAVSVVDVPSFNYLMIDGHGDPNTSPLYKACVEALFSLSYALKFAVKKRMAIDYAVMPLEGLWWTDNPQENLQDKSRWQWTMLIVQPDMVTAELVEHLRAETSKKKDLPQLTNLRFETWTEGKVAQILHRGAYKDEAPTIAMLHDSILEQGYRFRGKHHEIYLKDPSRSAPEKLETILRQPIS